MLNDSVYDNKINKNGLSLLSKEGHLLCKSYITIEDYAYEYADAE